MSDLYRDDDIEEAPPHPADPPQILNDFVGAFTDPQAQEVFRDAAVRIQDYQVQKSIADDNAAAANRLVTNLGVFKDGLANMAANDPASTFLGLDLVPDVVSGIVGTHPYLPDEARQDTYEQLTSDMQRDIARAGVLSLADKQEEAARNLLQHPRVAGLFDDNDQRALNGYINSMETARNVDAAALSQQRAKDEQQTRDHSMVSYFGALVDPQSGGLAFPPGWAEKVTADPSLPPDYTASMLNAYARLQTTGDVATSDPFMVGDIIRKIADGDPPSAGQILSQAGRGMEFATAIGLAKAVVGDMSPAARKEFGDLSATVDVARRTLAAPENGMAGQIAYGRFMDWFLRNYETLGPGALNPNSKEYFDVGPQIAKFAPNGSDLVQGATQGLMAGVGITERTGDRISLDQIFGDRRAPAGDTVIRGERKRPIAIPVVDYGDGTGEVRAAGSQLGPHKGPTSNDLDPVVAPE